MNPTSDTEMSDSNRPSITRRRALAMLAGAATTGTAAVALATEETDAQVSGDFTVPDASYSADGPNPTPEAERPPLRWSYQTFTLPQRLSC